MSLTASPATEGFPPFSWDRVPVSAHLSIGNGLTPEQSDFLADHFDLVTFQAGGKINGSIETKIAAGARAIKQRNPKAKVLFYWSCDLLKRPWKLSNAGFPEDGRLVAPKAGAESAYFDVSRPDVRDWWTDVAAKAVRDYACDGLFVDGVGTATIKWERVTDRAKVADLDKGLAAMLREARKKMGHDKLILFNPLHGDDGKREAHGEKYLPVADGAMMDDFDRAPELKQPSKEYLAAGIEQMRKTAQSGRILIFKAWPGFTWWSDPELMKKPHAELHRLAAGRITFPLACFLIGAERNCYFCYSWGWNGDYGTFDWYPEFDKPLGAPLGEAKKDGWNHQREFAHASVAVNLETKTGKIDWK